jgi:hypothetical protein
LNQKTELRLILIALWPPRVYFLAAHGVGLGARIYGSPTGNINSKKELFQIPSGYKAVIVLRIGNVDKSVDAVSAATPRKKFEEVVNYKK